MSLEVLSSTSSVCCAMPTVPFGVTDEGRLGELIGVGENNSLGGVTWNNSEGKELQGLSQVSDAHLSS